MSDPRGNAFRFDLREANGALGDIGTLLPLSLGTIALAGLSAPMVLMGFGLFYIITGLVYRLPVPVQPMKAIAAVAMLGVVSPAEIALSGVLIGLVLLMLGGSGLIDQIARLVPQSVLSGLQLGLGLSLGWVAVGLVQDQWLIGVLSFGVAITALRAGTHAALLTIIAGVAFGLIAGLPEGPPPRAAPWGMPHFDFADLPLAITDLALPQLALTLTNAVFLTTLVAGDLFGARAVHVSARNLCLTSGLANLLLAPMGALPMCHGAGGVAAHRRFGARTGAAPCMIGGLLLLIAILPPPVQGAILSAIPTATLGALLLIAAWELAISRRLIDARPSCRPVIAVTALATVLANPLLGLVAGTCAEIVRKIIVSKRKIRRE
ncbi:putative sulfate/molybdate transporter [Roseovarius sp. MMSF_3281]|uniref:putative sulfate/molybdate transporter n=1 Tax=Roseovarius sp. MMSF_3281 TaxID=3046694 RepID=UPI00273F2BB5|nr:putative sulfate/molybdate transporter [Roseovarius sp. MMSF_3281]